MKKDPTKEIAEALGLPPSTYRAVLTLQAGELPTLEIGMYPSDSAGNYILDEDNVGKRLAKVEFMLRLEKFGSLA